MRCCYRSVGRVSLSRAPLRIMFLMATLSASRYPSTARVPHRPRALFSVRCACIRAHTMRLTVVRQPGSDAGRLCYSQSACFAADVAGA
jgi:hypothetical protein